MDNARHDTPKRPSRDEYFMAIAMAAAARATCRRAAVGCVLVDHRGHILATGYNGTPPSTDHCLDTPCPYAGGARGTPCAAIHAEQNALIQCRAPEMIHTAYCTVMPCPACARMIAAAGAIRVVYAADHADSLVSSAIFAASAIRLDRFTFTGVLYSAGAKT